jgi:RNA polymerase-binding transcription factor DksA
MDEADITEAMREAAEAMREQDRVNRLSRPIEIGPELCDDCEGEMILIRRQWGLRRCVECQDAKEKLWKHFGKKP